MLLRPLQRNRVFGLLGSLSILALLMPVRESAWAHASALVPWIWVLWWTPARQELAQLTRRHTQLVWSSLGLACVIVAGCIVRQASPAELQVAPAPLAWMPVAALLITVHERAGTWCRRLPPAVLAAAITITASVICHQLWFKKEPRPQGLFYGVLNGPNLMTMAALLLAMTTKVPQLQRWRWYALVALAGAISSMARTPLFAFIAAILIVASWDAQRAKRTLLLGTSIVVGWAVFLKQRLLHLQKDMTTYQSGQYSSSAGDRLDSLRWASEHILDDIFFGMGPNDLQRAFNLRWIEWERPESSVTRIVHLHNDYIQIPIAYGLPALILFATFWGALVTNTTTDEPKNASALALASIGILATTALFDSYSYWIEGWSFIFTCAGFAVAIRALKSTGIHHA